MLIQKIPLLPATADQTLEIEIGGNPYILRVMWNERFGYFSLSISTADDEPVLTNIKMVKNYPLIGRFKNTLLPVGDFIFIQEKGTTGRPGYYDLATNYGLYYYEMEQEAIATVALETPAALIGTTWDSGLTTWDGGDTLWDQ